MGADEDQLGLRELLAAGEGRNVEFKSRVVPGGKLAREIAALANSGGGVLILGVRDDGTPCGCELAPAELKDLVADVRWRISPEPPLQVDVRECEGKRLYLLKLEGPLTPPYFVETDKGPVCLIRAGDACMEAPPLSRRNLPTAARRQGALPKVLERHLQRHGRITAPEYAALCNISARRARQELVSLVQRKCLTSYRQDRHEYFT